MIGQGLKVLKQNRFSLDKRKKFFAMRLGRRWNGLTKEAMDMIWIFKVSTGGALSNLLVGNVSLSMEGGGVEVLEINYL